MLIDALRRREIGAPVSPAAEPVPARRGTLRAWSRGLTTNLLNPKIGVFYLAMLPQFIPAGAPHLLMGAALALVHDVEGMIWFTAIILTAHKARRLFAGGAAKRAMDAVTGSVLIGFSVKLAASRN
jgi:threonine/homoserine/homoserine lactone efflux protein